MINLFRKPKRPGGNTKKKRDVRTKHNNPSYANKEVAKALSKK